MKDFLLILTNTFLAVLGQILLKHGMLKVGRVSVDTFIIYMFQALLNPFVLSGLAVYGFASMIWLVVLSRVNLSIAYPMISLSYIFSIVFAWLLFKEHIPYTRIVGGIVICIGVYLIVLK